MNLENLGVQEMTEMDTRNLDGAYQDEIVVGPITIPIDPGPYNPTQKSTF